MPWSLMVFNFTNNFRDLSIKSMINNPYDSKFQTKNIFKSFVCFIGANVIIFSNMLKITFSM
ncbi:hypothetical protein SAMN05660226_03431 [Parapedobacter luteus]|uniref:Uncharacterized protein n=1 Tax=Parapedobacter luteus TaxID=623280 RepID=A0A1T5EM65_9SPHI|nr:hypothetical protein SAMN05660226_03431 [Parapedobacter luteus]